MQLIYLFLFFSSYLFLFFSYCLFFFFQFYIFLFLFFSSYIYTVCCITDMPIKHTLGEGTTLVNVKIYRKNPAKCPSLAKNPPKYTTAYIVQQSNCRWHCEPTFFLGWSFNTEQSIHTLPLQSIHSYLSISNPSLSKPSVSSPSSV